MKLVDLFHRYCFHNNVKQVKKILDTSTINVNTLVKYSKYDPHCYETGFFVACEYNCIDVVKLLLSYRDRCNVDINKRDVHYRTPFYVACKNNNIEIIKLLIECDNIDINSPLDGKTPFYVACDKQYIDIVHIILSSGKLNISK